MKEKKEKGKKRKEGKGKKMEQSKGGTYSFIFANI